MNLSPSQLVLVDWGLPLCTASACCLHGDGWAGLSPSSGAKTRIRDAKVQLLMIGSVNTSSMHRSQLTLFRSRILDLIKINMKHQLWTLMVAWNNILIVENSDRAVHFYVGLEFRGLVLVLWLFVDTQQCIICKQCKG